MIDKYCQIATEEWRDIPGYNGRYRASSLGRIQAVGHPRRINHTFVMKPQPRGAGGYLGVCLYDPSTSKPRSQFIHVMVALAFLGPRPEGYQVNHKNGVKHANGVSNLEYLTASANARHGLASGFKKSTGKGRCLRAEEVRAIQAAPRTLSCRALGKVYGTSHETIRCIRLGTRWKCLDEHPQLSS